MWKVRQLIVRSAKVLEFQFVCNKFRSMLFVRSGKISLIWDWLLMVTSWEFIWCRLVSLFIHQGAVDCWDSKHLQNCICQYFLVVWLLCTFLYFCFQKLLFDNWTDWLTTSKNAVDKARRGPRSASCLFFVIFGANTQQLEQIQHLKSAEIYIFSKNRCDRWIKLIWELYILVTQPSILNQGRHHQHLYPLSWRMFANWRLDNKPSWSSCRLRATMSALLTLC